MTVFLSNKVYENMECLQAWKQVPPAAIEHVLDTVRNRLLTFILELEERYPEAGEEDLSQGKEFPEEEVKQVFNTYILGSHNVVASGGSVTQTVEQTVAKGDFDSLKLVLKELGIGDADLEELKEWADLELNGYNEESDTVPSYRRESTECFG
ncbi:MAG: hypothetical protein HW403_1325, partial [Dehalococcoidia bacterium]|nr:hypothetical protein [Dehalococcoidia bacterium]